MVRAFGRALGSQVAGWALLGCAVWGGAAGAQLRARPMAYPGVDAQGSVTTLPAALRTMAEQADVVFLGTVESVTRVGGDSGGEGLQSAGVVEVRFQVEQAVRGVSGGRYTMREWGGLWAGGEKRYLVGERRVMLLHRPSALGLSSPVGGMEGAIPVRGDLPRVTEASTSAEQAQGVADLRWIAAKLVRPVRYAATDQVKRTAAPATFAAEQEPEPGAIRGRAKAAGSPTLVHGVVGRPVLGPLPEPAQTVSSADGGTTMPVGDLLTWLRGWQAEERGVR